MVVSRVADGQELLSLSFSQASAKVRLSHVPAPARVKLQGFAATVDGSQRFRLAMERVRFRVQSVSDAQRFLQTSASYVGDTLTSVIVTAAALIQTGGSAKYSKLQGTLNVTEGHLFSGTLANSEVEVGVLFTLGECDICLCSGLFSEDCGVFG